MKTHPLCALLSLALFVGCASKTSTSKPPTKRAATALELKGDRLDDIARQEDRIRQLREEIQLVRAHLDSTPSDTTAIRRIGALITSEEEARKTRDDIKQSAEDERLRSGLPSDEAQQREERQKDRLFLPH